MSARVAFVGVLGWMVGCADERSDEGAWVGMSAAEAGGPDDEGSGGGSGDSGSAGGTMADDDYGDHGDASGAETTSAADDRGGDEASGDETGTTDCPAHCYCEPLDPDADIDDLIAGYSQGAWAETIFAVLERRWPAGRDLLMDQVDDPYFGSFTDTSSFAGLMDGLMTEAHEGTHGWDYGHAEVDTFAYFLRGDLQYYPSKLHGFDRSEIYGLVEGTATDLYKDLYLSGQQGSYGFYELVDEGNCYINGMAAIGVVGEHIPYGISGRDGAIAFLYYLELYLGLARTQHPDVYAQIQGDPEWVELIQTQWLRTHFHLERAAHLHPQLGIYDAEIEALLYAEDNQAEIELLIGHELDASSCLPQ